MDCTIDFGDEPLELSVQVTSPPVTVQRHDLSPGRWDSRVVGESPEVDLGQ